MKSNSTSLLLNITKSLIYFFCIFYISIFLYSLFIRVSYPYDLEWIEGSVADNVVRLLNGQNIYTAPNTSFVPFIYTPFYFYTCSFFSNLFGFSLSVLRLVSIISTFGCCLIIFSFVYRCTNDLFSSFISSSFFIACYGLSGAWYDLARIDMLLFLLLLLGLYVLYFSKSHITIIISALLLVLAYFTKQNAQFMILLTLAYSLTRGVKVFIIYTFTITTGIILGIFILNSYSGGWFGYYTNSLTVDLFGRIVDIKRLITIWTKDFIGITAIAFGISVYYVVYRITKTNIKDWSFDLLLLIGFISVSFINRVINGGYVNALIPFFCFIALEFGTSYNTITKDFINIKPIYAVLLNILVLTQFVALVYNPINLLPTRDDKEAGDSFVNIVKNIEGDVLILSHGNIAHLAGKKESMHLGALYDVANSKDKTMFNEIKSELISKVESKNYGAIILDNAGFFPDEEMLQLIKTYYYCEELPYNNERVFFPKSGSAVRPKYIYLPKK